MSGPAPGAPAYPLQRPMLHLGVWLGLAVAALLYSLTAGLIVLTACWLAGLLWRRGEIPVFAFCMLYQWLFVGTGYLHRELTGAYPGAQRLGDLDTAVQLSLLGLLVLAAGLRLGLPRPGTLGSTPRGGEYDARRLFWVVIVLFSANWFVELSAGMLMRVSFDAAQILHNLLVFRYLFLFLLLIVIARQQRHYGLGLIAFAFVMLPETISSMTKFKELVFMALIVLLGEWRPGSPQPQVRRRNARVLGAVAAISAALFATGLVWTGGLKYDWRMALRSGEVAGNPIEKLDAYQNHFVRSVEDFDLGRSAEALAERMSSGVAYFSDVLERVPRVIPHEHGELTLRAFRHVLMPRILFPEKPNLGGDSWLVRRYAGVYVAGNESATSIGLGYMAEFYIDFGALLMFVPLLLYGLFMGSLCRALARVSPSAPLLSAAVAGLFTQHFMSYEGDFTKLFGGVLQSFLIFMAVLWLLGPWLHGLLLAGARRAARLAPGGGGI